jgi:hypothetical protein
VWQECGQGIVHVTEVLPVEIFQYQREKVISAWALIMAP